jgi:hypothetical protein
MIDIGLSLCRFASYRIGLAESHTMTRPYQPIVFIFTNVCSFGMPNLAVDGR